MALRQLRWGQDVGRSIPQDVGRDSEGTACEPLILSVAFGLEVGASRKEVEPRTGVDLRQSCEAAPLV